MLKKFKWAGVGATIFVLGSLAGCGGGGSGAAGTPLLGSKSVNTYNLSLSSTTLTTSSPLTVKFTAKDASGNGISNLGVNIAFSSNVTGGLDHVNFLDPATNLAASCGIFQGQTTDNDRLCSIVTSGGSASIELVATQAPTSIPVTVQVIPFITPANAASAPTSAASAAQDAVTGIQAFQLTN